MRINNQLELSIFYQLYSAYQISNKLKITNNATANRKTFTFFVPYLQRFAPTKKIKIETQCKNSVP